MRKTLVIIGCVLLLTAVAPAALAHWQTSSADTDPGAPTATDGASGTVVGVAGPAITNEWGRTTATGLARCDMEVGDPHGQDSALNEPFIDGYPTFDGQVPESTWEDGGYGAVCHTDHYTIHPEWNTPGCGSSPHSAARADTTFGAGDTAHGGPGVANALFVGAGCDFGTSLSPSPDEQVNNFALCVVNEGVFGDGGVDAILGCPQYVTDPSGPMTCEPQTGTVQRPSAMDAIEFGHATPFSGPSVPGTGDCASGTTTVFVFASLDLSGDDYPVPAISANVISDVWTV